MGVCFRRTLVARIFAVVLCVCVCVCVCVEFEETVCSGEEVWMRAREYSGFFIESSERR